MGAGVREGVVRDEERGADAETARGRRSSRDPGSGRDSVRVLRLRRQIVSQTRLVAAALTLPVIAAMLWFAIPRGTWPRVVIAFVFIAVLYLVGAALLRGVSIRLARDGLVERGFFVHDNRISAKRIASVVLVDVYAGASSDTTRQLFLLDGSGALLLRMRGEFWSDDSLDAVATAYPVPVQRLDTPITADRLRAELPELLYWFERWPWAGRAAVAGTIAAFALILIALMSPSVLVVA
ncbi:hypothetical protein N1031_16790 [Herbiconiux moechotypicola]|uniref:PH domain-containing protein n=1 Tax=Herbiconiux moechotypicola TaxID=637393 RepID=A0ABN3DQF5_9MICO|nr:hypothetical protein [Herbiconiux moechotypicola]MCS5731421.1 hypothetical protein [Herbiconiux moechotypicola]